VSNPLSIIGVLLVIAWMAIYVLVRVLFPILISRQLASKDRRLAAILLKIPLFRFGKRADPIDKLLRKPQNKQFMHSRYPVMYHWHGFFIRWYRRIYWGFAGILLLTQLWGVGKFVLDPKGELDRIRDSAQKWEQQRRNND